MTDEMLTLLRDHFTGFKLVLDALDEVDLKLKNGRDGSKLAALRASLDAHRHNAERGRAHAAKVVGD